MKVLTTLGVAAMVASLAGQALALNPQPLPPRKFPVTAHHTLAHFRRHSPWGHHHASHHHASHHSSHHSSHHASHHHGGHH